MGVLSSTKPDPWTLSPQMTAAPELWRGAMVWPFWNLNEPIINAHNNVTSYVVDNGNTQITSRGHGIAIPKSGAGGIRTPGDLSISGGITHTAFLLFSDIFDTWQYFSDGRAGTGTYFAKNGVTDDINYASSASLDNFSNFSNREVVITVTDDGTNVNYYRDGVLNGSHSNGVGSVSSGFRIGSRFSDVDELGSDSPLLMYVLHAHVLRAADVEALHADPFAMLRPAGF